MAQTDLNGSDVKPTNALSTEQFNTKAFSAGKLTESGEDFVLDELRDAKSEYGPMLVICGHRIGKEDEPFELMTSSGKLMKLFKVNFESLKGKHINVSGIGEKYTREYSIRLL